MCDSQCAGKTELTLDVIRAVKVIKKYLLAKGYHSLRVVDLGGLTINRDYYSNSDYISPIDIDAQMVRLQDEEAKK